MPQGSDIGHCRSCAAPCPRALGSALQKFHCPLPPGSEAVHCRSCPAHCPRAVRQCIAGVGYSFVPPVPFRYQCQLSLTALSDWLQDRACIPAQAIYEARWGVTFMPGGGLPLDWFDHDQQRHITAHRMDNIPTMAVLAHRSSHQGTVLDTTCLLCGTQPETAPHLWGRSAQSHEWGPARRRLAAWLDQKVGPRAALVRH